MIDVAARAAVDGGLVAQALDVDDVVAAAGPDREPGAGGRAEDGDAVGAVVERRGRAAVGQAQLEVLDALQLEAAVARDAVAGERVGLDAEAGALDDQEAIADREPGVGVDVVAVDRHRAELAGLVGDPVGVVVGAVGVEPDAVEADQRELLAHLGLAHDLGLVDRAEVRAALLVVHDDLVAGALELVAAADREPPEDLARVEVARGLERERQRVDGDRRRLDLLGALLPVPEAVLDRHHADGDLDPAGDAEPGEEAVAAAGGDARRVDDRAERDHRAEDPEQRPQVVDVVVDDRRARGLGLREVDVGPQRAAAAEPLEEVDGERDPVQRARRVGVDELRRQRDLEGRRRVGERRRVEDQRRGVAADVDRVVARAAGDDRLELVAGRQDVDLVRAAGAVDLDGLDARERHDPAGARDVVVGDDEDVADRRADHDDRVHAGAAVDEHRRVLQVVVAVVARAAEQVREVGDLVRVVRVLAQDQEGLEQEAVVAGAAVQVELAAVVVDLEAVVLAVAEHEQRGGVAVRHVLGVRHRDALGVLERAVSAVRDERHRADDELVVAAAHVDDRHRGGVVGAHAVGAAQRVDLDALDVAVGHERRGDVEGLDDPDPEGAAAGRVEADVVALVGAVDDQHVLAGPTAAVGDLDPRLVARRDRDHVVLGELVGRVPGRVERRPPLPRGDDAGDAADLDRVVGVRDRRACCCRRRR